MATLNNKAYPAFNSNYAFPCQENEKFVLYSLISIIYHFPNIRKMTFCPILGVFCQHFSYQSSHNPNVAIYEQMAFINLISKPPCEHVGHIDVNNQGMS